MTGRTVLVTGLPRAGTTLTCELLNLVPDAVALDEPMDWGLFTGGRAQPPSLLQRAGNRIGTRSPRSVPSPDAICDNIGRFCDAARSSLRQEGTAVSRHVGGKVLGSKVADHTTDGGLRAKLAERGQIRIDRQLTDGFLLAVKHNSGFTALLPHLVSRFPVYAVVRNPLSILSSWQTVPFPPQRGHVQMGEAFDPVLAADLASLEDRWDRQFHLVEWFFSRFERLLRRQCVIRYEDLVSSGGSALGVVTPAAGALEVPLENRNKGRAVYDMDASRRLGQRLLDQGGAWQAFYDHASVELLLAG